MTRALNQTRQHRLEDAKQLFMCVGCEEELPKSLFNKSNDNVNAEFINEVLVT